MTNIHRVLPRAPITSFKEYIAHRGGSGLRAAIALGTEGVLDELDASGLRGRGGAGFPTGRKWRTVWANRSQALPTSIVVNAAEGEPGTFKDRTILRNNPFAVLEGALIAARTLDADEIIVATKQSFGPSLARLHFAAHALRSSGWCDGISIEIFEGPAEYLYGEETALLETIDGRYPLPRIAPPYRRGVREVVTTPAAVDSGSKSSARVAMAGPHEDIAAPPALVNNVETFANVAQVLARGAAWFRAVGTPASPGTVVCTVTGSTRHHGVAEYAMGTPLAHVLAKLGRGPLFGRTFTAVLPGVANGLIPADRFDVEISHEGFAAIDSGLGSAGFIVLDDSDDPVAVVAGASHFLAVESCGQCTPCKLGGLHLAKLLAKLARSEATEHEIDTLLNYLTVVGDSARCSLAGQQQAVIRSLFEHFPEAIDAHLRLRAAPAEPTLIAEIVDIRNGLATLDAHHRDKQPDWTYNTNPSGKTPAARLSEHRDARLAQ